MKKTKTHISVLQKEVMEALAIKKTSAVVDATLGVAGHAQLIIAKLSHKGTFVGIDADERAVADCKDFLKKAECTTHLCVGNFRNIDSILDRLHIENVDSILADLGWRMEQFSGNGKGFSFQVDEPLIMTYGDATTYSFTAGDIINDWKEDDIANVLKGYGEERFARKIARKIVERRDETPILTTQSLVTVIESAVPPFYQRARIHPATRTFQALRIAVNDELDALDECIRKSVVRLNPRGRLVIITFHSLEDRIVKHLFRNFAHDHVGIVLTKKPITASREEIMKNPRARSAKLRIFEKI